MLRVEEGIFPRVSTQLGPAGRRRTDHDVARDRGTRFEGVQASAREGCSRALPVARGPFALVLHLGVTADNLGWERSAEIHVTEAGGSV